MITARGRARRRIWVAGAAGLAIALLGYGGGQLVGGSAVSSSRPAAAAAVDGDVQ